MCERGADDRAGSPLPTHLDCLAVVHQPSPEGGAGRAGPWRLCPFGAVAAVDCPELYDVRCPHRRPRGAQAPRVLPEAEERALAAEVGALGYPGGRYLARVRPLWGVPAPAVRVLPAGTALGAGEPPGVEAASPEGAAYERELEQFLRARAQRRTAPADGAAAAPASA